MNAYIQALLGILLSAILTENFILVKFYGICPFMGVSKKIDTALGMGMAVTFVMAMASAACFAVNKFLLIPLSCSICRPFLSFWSSHPWFRWLRCS